MHNLTTIARKSIINGFSIPSIIWNMDYHFINLPVYSDGLIDCWEMVDLELFKDKLEKKWVVTSIPDGESISIYSLGRWTIGKGEWLFNKETFYDYVNSLIEQLNPRRENLYNCYQRTTEKVGSVEVSILGQPYPEPYYVSHIDKVFPHRIEGKKFSIFFRDNDTKLYLAELSIFKDGHVEIACLPQKRGFELSEIRGLIDNQQMITDIPVGERVYIMGVGSFIVTRGKGVYIESKYREFLDEYDQLTGKEGSIKKCRRIFEAYENNPTPELRDELKDAYEAVPDHQKIFVGDMDTKDTAVRMIIYGEQEIERWSHYRVAKEMGMKLPVIDIPKIKDEE